MEIMTQREEHWKRKLEREQVARKRLEEKLKSRVSLWSREQLYNRTIPVFRDNFFSHTTKLPK
jgi:hypothetical protein